MKKFITSVVLTGLFMVGCGSTSEEATTDTTSDELIVGLEANYTPYNWTTTEEQKSDYAVPIDGSNLYADGYDVRVAGYIAEQLDKELVVKKLDWDGLIPAVNSNTIDLIIAGMSPTQERMNSIAFSDSYFTEDMELVVVTTADSPYASSQTLDDFDGATVAAQMGTFHVELLDQMAGVEQITNYDNYATMINNLQNGTIDAYIAERNVAQSQVNANDDFIYISFADLGNQTFELKPEYYTVSVGLRQNDTELLADVNGALATLPEETRQQWMDDAIVQVEQLNENE